MRPLNTGERYQLIDYVQSYYKKSWRTYHNYRHIQNMLDHLKIAGVDSNEAFIATLFHDIICDPLRHDNEVQSCAFLDKAMLPFKANIKFKGVFTEEGSPEINVPRIKALIMATANPYKYYDDPEIREFIRADFGVFIDSNSDKMINYEHRVFSEFQEVPLDEYIIGRLKILNRLHGHINDYQHAHMIMQSRSVTLGGNTRDMNVMMPSQESEDNYCIFKDSDDIPSIQNNIENLMRYVSNRKYKIGYFAGTFDPLHIGHMDIIKQAERTYLFDKIVICRQMNRFYEYAPGGIPRTGRQTIAFDKLLVDFLHDQRKFTFSTHIEEMKNYSVDMVMIVGIRNQNDLTQEQAQHEVRKLTSIKPMPTVYIICNQEYSHVSSTMIRDIQKHDKIEAEQFLVKEIE